MTKQRDPAGVAGVAVTLLGVVALAFVAHVVFVSRLVYERSQITAYADLRTDLANAVVPIGQTTVDGKLVAPGTAIAVLRIPALDLSAVVFEGTSPNVLTKGPGHRRDTVLPGQVGTSVIMGRRATYGGPFGDLPRLRPGDEIITVTGQGNSATGAEGHVYKVTGLRRPGDPVTAPASGSGRLTLITADGPEYLPQRVVRVDAELVGPTEPTPARVNPGPLPAAELAMGVDRDAWVVVVFWGQGLLLAAIALTWLRIRWGFWQAWIVGVPVLGGLALGTADAVVRLFPNIM